jgi:hypothetical protein
VTTHSREAHELPTDAPGVGDLFGRLAAQTSTLMRQELSLVRLEISHKLRSIMRTLLVMGAGGVVLVLGFEILIYAGLIRLGMEIPLWIAAVIVGASLFIVGLIVLGLARSALRRIELLPVKTIETLKENKQWARQLVQ